MNPGLPLILLGALGGLLSLVIVWELLPETEEPPPAATIAGAKPASPPRHPSTSDDDLPDKGDLVATLMSRPLFDPSRRAEKAAGPVDAPSDDQPSTLPRLAGIMVSGDDKRAIFQGDGDDKPVVVGEGEELAGWLIQEIAAKSVTVAGPNGTETIEPKLDPNAKPGEPALPAQPPQAHPAPPMPAPNMQPGQPFPLNRFQGPVGIHGPVPRRPGVVPPNMPVMPRPVQAPTGGNR